MEYKEGGESIKIKRRNWLICGGRRIMEYKEGRESIRIRRRNLLI